MANENYFLFIFLIFHGIIFHRSWSSPDGPMVSCYMDDHQGNLEPSKLTAKLTAKLKKYPKGKQTISLLLPKIQHEHVTIMTRNQVQFKRLCPDLCNQGPWLKLWDTGAFTLFIIHFISFSVCFLSPLILFSYHFRATNSTLTFGIPPPY